MSFKDKLKTLLSLPTGTKTRQFEEDVNWCIEEISHHFSALPYWEEFYKANFCRHDNNDAAYWAKVNKEATKRLTDTVITLPYQEAYRELNRMALFAINIMAGALLDRSHNKPIDKEALDKILTITHRQLSVRAPSSLLEHDEILKDMQACIDHFCASIGEPSAEFIEHSDKLNQIRLNETAQDSPNRTQSASVNAFISKLAPLQDALNANIISHTACLSMILKRPGYGNNNIVYFGQAINVISAASDYCMKNQVPLNIVDMTRPSLISEEQKEQILSRTQQHDRYSMVLEHDDLTSIIKRMDIQKPDNCALLDILDYITQYSMTDEKQHILIIQNFHKSQYTKWFNDIMVDVTCFNRVCWNHILFIDSSFE